jgi:hypothetical protein
MTEPSIKCPFCGKAEISCEPGTQMCPVCLARFRVDDWGECIFVSLNSPRIPLNGTYYPNCGLIQGHENETCYLCGELLKNIVH